MFFFSQWGNWLECNWPACVERQCQELPLQTPLRNLMGEFPVTRLVLLLCLSILVLMTRDRGFAEPRQPTCSLFVLQAQAHHKEAGAGVCFAQNHWPTQEGPATTTILSPVLCQLPCSPLSLGTPFLCGSALWGDGDQDLIGSPLPTLWLESFQWLKPLSLGPSHGAFYNKPPWIEGHLFNNSWLS